MEYIIVFIIGFGLGWFLQSWISAKAFYEILKDLDVPEDKILDLLKKDGVDVSNIETVKSTKTVVDIRVEQVGDRLMAYSAKDNFFVAQGQDAAALFEVILNKYPVGYTVQIVEGSDLIKDHLEYLKQQG